MSNSRLFATFVFALATLTILGALGWVNFFRRPAFTDLSVSWFERPLRGDPRDWRLPGAGVINVSAAGPVRVLILPGAGKAITVTHTDPRVTVTPQAQGVSLTSVASGPRCAAAAPSDAPLVEVHGPSNLVIHAAGPVFLEIGPADTVMMDLRGCARAHLARAAHLGLAARGRVAVDAERLDRSLDAMLHGPGRLRVGSLIGTLDADAWGGGRIEIDKGNVSPANLFAKGGATILDHGQATAVTAQTRLRSQIRIAETLGVVSADGDVLVGRPGAPIPNF